MSGAFFSVSELVTDDGIGGCRAKFSPTPPFPILGCFPSGILWDISGRDCILRILLQDDMSRGGFLHFASRCVLLEYLGYKGTWTSGHMAAGLGGRWELGSNLTFVVGELNLGRSGTWEPAFYNGF